MPVVYDDIDDGDEDVIVDVYETSDDSTFFGDVIVRRHRRHSPFSLKG